MVFQVQKLLNSKFNKWRTNTHNSIDVPYNWGGATDSFGVTGFEIITTSGLSILQSDGNELFSHPAIIYNDATHTYTLSVNIKYDHATGTNANIWVREFDESNTSTANYNWTPALTASYVTNTLTIGGAGGADVTLNANTAFVQITFKGTDTVNYLWSCSRCELLGDSISLDRGFMLPLEQSETLLQKSGISSSGDVSAPQSYGPPLKHFLLDTERMSKADYDRLYLFLNNTDISVNQYPFNYTDEDSNTYFGKIIDPRVALGANAYYNTFISLTFQQLPY